MIFLKNQTNKKKAIIFCFSFFLFLTNFNHLIACGGGGGSNDAPPYYCPSFSWENTDLGGGRYLVVCKANPGLNDHSGQFFIGVGGTVTNEYGQPFNSPVGETSDETVMYFTKNNDCIQNFGVKLNYQVNPFNADGSVNVEGSCSGIADNVIGNNIIAGYDNNFGITASKSTSSCAEFNQFSVPYYNSTKYTWSVPGGIAPKQWGSGQGIDVSGFNKTGSITVSVTLSPQSGACSPYGNITKTFVVNVTNRISPLVLNPVVTTCDQYGNLQVPYYNNVNYNWVVPGAIFDGNTNSSSINVKGYNLPGTFPLICTITPINGSCGSAVTGVTLITVQPKVAGPLLDNNSGLAAGIVRPAVNGLFSLRLQQLINGATYTWEVPDSYGLDYGTPYISTKTVTETSGQYNGLFPINSLIDFNGKVTVNGPCGGQVFNFTIKARQAASAPQNFRTCTLNSSVYITNPNNDYIDAVWFEGSGATATIRTNSRVDVAITDGGASGVYRLGMAVRNVGNLYTNIIYNQGSGTWASGTLSDERRDVGSNLALSQQRRVYYSTRDGKMWYYEYDNGLAKWDALPLTGVTNAKVVTNGFSDVAVNEPSNNKPVVYYLASNNQIYKWENGGQTQYGTYLATKLYIYNELSSNYTGKLFFRKPDGAIWVGDATSLPVSTGISNVDDERFVVYGAVLYYVKGGYIYKATVGNGASETQLVSGKTVLTGTDLEVVGSYIYFTGSDKVLYRANINTGVLDGGLTPTGYSEGQFAINKTTEVVYVNTKDPLSLYYRIGQVYKQGSAWLTKNATNSSTRPNDYAGSDIVFTAPNVIYVTSANKRNEEGENINSVWNLYFYDSCTPAVYRKGNDEETIIVGNSVNNAVNVFPNPFSKEINITAEQGNILGLYDNFGKLITEISAVDGTNTIETGNLSSGFYLLKVSKDGKTIATQKLVK